MAAAVTPSIPVQALVIYGITATTIIDSSTAAVVDNRSPSRRNGIHSYRAYGTGSWSVEIFFADGDPSGWVSYGSTGQVSQASQSGIGYGIDPNIDGKTYHDFIQFVITGDAAIQSYCGLKDVWSLPSQGSLSFPITVEQGGTGGITAPVTSFNTRSGDVTLTAADVAAVEQDLQTSASPTFSGLTTTTATIATFTSTSGTITTLTATNAAIAALTATSVAVTRTGAVPVTVTRTDGGTALSVVVGNVVLASGTLTASGTVTGGALSTSGALTAASAALSGNLSVGGTLSAGSFSSTTPLAITVASGVALTATQSAGGTAILLPVGNLVLSAGNVTASGSLNGSSAAISGNATIAGSLASGPTTVTGALAVSGAASAASAAVAGLIAAGSLTTTTTIVATGSITGASIATAGAVTAASATLSGAAISASLKVTTLSVYANNAAALLGGLTAGQVYRITGSDNLAVVH